MFYDETNHISTPSPNSLTINLIIDQLKANFRMNNKPFILLHTPAFEWKYEIEPSKSIMNLAFSQSILYDSSNYPYQNAHQYLANIDDCFKLTMQFFDSQTFINPVNTCNLNLKIKDVCLHFYFQHFISRLLPYFIEQVPNAFYPIITNQMYIAYIAGKN